MKKIIEAALFTSPGAVNLRELAKITNSNVAEVRVLVNELMHDYDAKDTSLEIIDEPDGVRMCVKEDYEDYVSHMAAAPELHRGIMKTLAYIAYKQPVKQSDVINFRNSKAYEHIKLLKEKGFIKKEKQGITYIISTTPKFKEYFGKDAGAGEAPKGVSKESSGAPKSIQMKVVQEGPEANPEDVSSA